MIGAIIGDMVGSVYENKKIGTKDFNIFNMHSRMSDDSLLTLAVAKVFTKHFDYDFSENGLKKLQAKLIDEFINTFSHNIGAGFGYYFAKWCLQDSGQKPYNSFGNGGAMRISPVAYVARNLDEVKLLSKIVTEITHNHPEGLMGAEAIAVCVYLALHNYSKEYIRSFVFDNYYKEITKYNFEELIKNNRFSVKAVDTVPVAIYLFLQSTSLEDAIRSAVAIGGDTDTIACMAASIAEPFYEKEKKSKFTEKFEYFMIDPFATKVILNFNDKFIINN